MTDSGGPPPAGERQREGIKNLGLHNELGLSDSRAVMGRAYLKAMGLVISHASHTFGGRRIEHPQGGDHRRPTLLFSAIVVELLTLGVLDVLGVLGVLGVCIFKCGSLAIRGRRSVTQQILIF